MWLHPQGFAMFSSRISRHLQQVSSLARSTQGSTATSNHSRLRLCTFTKLVPKHTSKCNSCKTPHSFRLQLTPYSSSSYQNALQFIYSQQQSRKASTLSLSLGLNDHLLSSRQTPPKHVENCCESAGPWVEQRRYAGHSKWANIKHIKAGKDAEKANLTMRLTKTIRIAIREGGSADPKSNIQLARVMEQANQADVPKSTIEKTIKDVVKGNESGSTVFFDAKIPGSFMMIIETFTPSPKRCRNEILGVFKKLGGQLNDKISTHFFDYKGVVVVSPGGSLSNYEAAEEAGIMAEAEEVEETLDEGGNPVYQFICDSKAVHGVKTNLTEQYPDIEIHEAGFRYMPKVFTHLNEPGLEAARKILDSLESLEDVVRVYTNIKAEGDP